MALLFGQYSTGKSGVALALAASVQAGNEFLGLEVEHGPILYADYETDADTLHERLFRLARGLGLGVVPVIHYRRLFGPLADEVPTLSRYIDAEGVRLVIIDSLGLACGGEVESAEVVLRLFAGIRQLRCTTLATDHTAKHSSPGQKRTAFGSVYKTNSPRSVWEVKTSRYDDGTLHIALFHRKVNDGRLERPLSLRMTFTEDATTITPEDARDVPLLGEGLSAGEPIWLALEQPISTGELAEELGLSAETVRQACGRDPRITQAGRDGKQTLWARLSNREEL